MFDVVSYVEKGGDIMIHLLRIWGHLYSFLMVVICMEYLVVAMQFIMMKEWFLL